jgi:hypothetical protein
MVVPVVAVFANGLLDCHILQCCLRIGYTCVKTVNSRMTRIGQVEWPCLAGQRRHAKLSNRRAQLAKLFLLRLPPPSLSKHTYIYSNFCNICLQSHQLRPRRRRRRRHRPWCLVEHHNFHNLDKSSGGPRSTSRPRDRRTTHYTKPSSVVAPSRSSRARRCPGRIECSVSVSASAFTSDVPSNTNQFWQPLSSLPATC